MRLLIAGLFLVLAFGGFTEASAKQSQQVSVKINNEKTTARGNVRIKFLEMVEDSRCPADANCVWAGNAKIKIRVTRNGKSKILTLNTMQSGAAPAFAGYSFKLTGLTPEPRSNIRINRNGYVASIEINRTKG